jgi:hypothetical protein
VLQYCTHNFDGLNRAKEIIDNDFIDIINNENRDYFISQNFSILGDNIECLTCPEFNYAVTIADNLSYQLV